MIVGYWEIINKERKGPGKSFVSLLKVRVNISEQWLIGSNNLGDC